VLSSGNNNFWIDLLFDNVVADVNNRSTLGSSYSLFILYSSGRGEINDYFW
jgi:hypothetical protein